MVVSLYLLSFSCVQTIFSFKLESNKCLNRPEEYFVHKTNKVLHHVVVLPHCYRCRQVWHYFETRGTEKFKLVNECAFSYKDKKMTYA